MAHVMAQAFAQAGFAGKGSGKGGPGPKLVDQRKLVDGDPFTGDWTRFHSWYTLLCNVLEIAPPELAEILERLYKCPAANTKDEDLTPIVGKADPLAHTAYQSDLFRAAKDGMKGT